MKSREAQNLSELAQFRASEWLSSEDLLGAGKESVVMTITDFQIHEDADMGEGRKVSGGSISLKGTERKLFLNSTNRKALRRIHGDARSDLIGQRITVYVDHNVRGVGGKVVDGLRIKEAPAKKSD